MDSSIREKIPQPIDSILAEIQYLVLDAIDSLLGRREPLIPPRRLMYDGPRAPKIFKENGAEFFRYYVELCHLKPSEAILDVGCGLGRKTLPLINRDVPE